jgi:eukaryotic-like serine/threonine-protein kinase
VAPEKQAGDVVDLRYELLGQIRAGGMGVVWRAQDLLVEREVAIKEIRFPPILGEQQRAALSARLVADAKAVAGLGDPGVVAVIDVLAQHVPPLVVTELVEVPTVADVVASEGPLPPDRVGAIGLDVLQTLEAASAKGIVHRFLRPSRILLPPDGGARLADFGVMALVGDPDVNASGSVSGSASYLPPEMPTQPGGSLASDLWALGATLYFAVEGCPPFGGDTAQATLRAIAGGQVRPPERAGSLAPVLEALLDKDPAARPEPERLRAMLGAVALVPVGAAVGPSEPVEVLDRMFHRDPDTPQLHLLPPEPEPDDEPGDGRPARVKHVQRRTKKVLTAAGALLVVAVLGALLAGGGRHAVVRKRQTAQAQQWTTYTDPATGFKINHPNGWTVTQDGRHSDFRDPTTGAALRVGYTKPAQASPEQVWLTLEQSFQAEHPSYKRVRLSQSVHAGLPAAIWEFTWTDNGIDLHNYDVGFTSGPYSLALNYQTKEADWERLRGHFDQFAASFQPPPQ